MERVITIKYNWKRADSGEEVWEHHKDYLDESALERIFEMMKQGYTCGELHDNIFCREDEDEGQDGTDYIGNWSL